MEVTLKGDEVVCVKALARCYEENRASWTGLEGWEELGLTVENHTRILGLMEHCGAISGVMRADDEQFYFFNITARAVQMAREIDTQEENRQAKAKEGKDIVEHVKLTLRKHPVMGWLCVVGIGLIAAVTALNQFVSLFKNLGWL